MSIKTVVKDKAKVHEENEQEFLSDLLTAYKKWKNKGEEEYAQAYRLLLNQFTTVTNE